MNNLFRITENNIKNFYSNTTNTTNIKNNKNNTINEIKNIINNKNNITDKIKNIAKTNYNFDPNNILNNKILWKFGKSKIKTENFKKYMSKNLAILYFLNEIFVDFIINNSSLELNNINSFFNNNTIIFSNKKGSIKLIDKQIYININKEKISGIYKIKDCGYLKFSDININEDYLKINKIPDLDSILNYSNDFEYIFKIIKIFNNFENIKTKINCYGDLNFLNLIHENLSTIFNFNNNNDFFKSCENFSFYIKVYDTHSKAFIIDNNTNLIYYISSLENYKDCSGYLFFYILELDLKCKIISYDI